MYIIINDLLTLATMDRRSISHKSTTLLCHCVLCSAQAQLNNLLRGIKMLIKTTITVQKLKLSPVTEV